jgi:hypothetical protein
MKTARVDSNHYMATHGFPALRTGPSRGMDSIA